MCLCKLFVSACLLLGVKKWECGALEPEARTAQRVPCPPLSPVPISFLCEIYVIGYASDPLNIADPSVAVG